jgi:hypothetical protein
VILVVTLILYSLLSKRSAEVIVFSPFKMKKRFEPIVLAQYNIGILFRP